MLLLHHLEPQNFNNEKLHDRIYIIIGSIGDKLHVANIVATDIQLQVRSIYKL